MDSAPSMDTVLQALNVLYHQPEETGKEKASQFLSDMQKSVYAWEIADQLLQSSQDLETCYFAAHTMRSKIQMSFGELPAASHQSFRDSLLNHCMKVNADTPKAITTQLCLALSDLILQMSSWQNAASQLIQQFGANQQYWTFLLEVLTVTPEEVDNRLLRLGANRTEEIQKELVSASQLLLELLTVVLDASSNNEKIQSMVFICLSSWLVLDVIPQQHLLASKLLSTVFSALANTNCPASVHTAAADCAVSALYPGEDLQRNLSISQLLFEGITGLIGPYQQAASEQKFDKVANYCRVFTHMAESFLDAMVNTPNQGFGDLRTVDLVLSCMDYPDYNVADITFTFWNELSDVLYEVNKQTLIATFQPYIQRLILALCKHCRLPASQVGVQLERNDFTEFRVDASDLVAEFEPCFNAANIMKQMFELMTAAGQNASWEVLESALYIMISVAKYVDPHDEKVVPHIVPTLLGISTSAHLAVQHNTVKLVGFLSSWLNAHHQFLEPVMKFLLVNVQQQKLSCVSAAAIKDVCTTCSTALGAHLPTLFQLMHSVDQLPLSNNAVNWLIKGTSAVLGKTTGSVLVDNFRLLCFLQVEPLNKMIDTQTQPITRSKKETDPAVWLDRLSSIFIAINLSVTPGQPHPCQQIIEEMWPVLSKAANKYASNEDVMERLFRCIRYALRLMGKHLNALFNSVLTQVVQIFQQHHHTCCLYLGSVLVDEYGDERTFVPPLLDMLQTLCAPSFEVLLAPGGVKNNPDLLEDFFRLASKFMARCAVPFMKQSNCFTKILAVAITGLSVDHRETQEAMSTFLKNFILSSLSNTDSHDFLERRMLVRGLFDGIGQSLVAGIVKACMFDIRRSMICFPAQVFFYMLAMSRVIVLQWLEDALKNLPNQTPGGTVRATPKQLSDFHVAISSADSAEKVEDLFCDFSELYR